MTETQLPVSAEEWARLRAEAVAAPPPHLSGEGVLLPYQRRLIEAVEQHEVVAFPKSRRIGATWGIGAKGVLLSGAARTAGGMDTLYIGYNLDMAREFIDVCAMWARSFSVGAGQVGEFLFADQDEHGHSRDIQAFRIQFASGFEIVALASRPRSLRGRQGFVIIDEAAFHDDLPGVLKAALAFLVWGGRVLVVSTHDGDENPFNELVNEIRAGKRAGHVLQTDFDEAVREGLYARVCLVKGWNWSPEAEAAWRAKIRAFYGEGAAEELDVIPRSGGARYLPLALIEARTSREVPVLRLTYTVPGWRGASGALWRPNTLARVDDAFLGIARELLIVSVTFLLSAEDGTVTELEVAPPEAFERLPEAEERGKGGGGGLVPGFYQHEEGARNQGGGAGYRREGGL